MGSQPRRQLSHVFSTVTPYVVNTDIEQMCTFLDLIPSNLDASVPIGFEHQLPELLGSVRVSSLTDH